MYPQEAAFPNTPGDYNSHSAGWLASWLAGCCSPPRFWSKATLLRLAKNEVHLGSRCSGSAQRASKDWGARVSGLRVQRREPPSSSSVIPHLPTALGVRARYRARGTQKLGYPPRSISEDLFHKYCCAPFLLQILHLLCVLPGRLFYPSLSQTRVNDPPPPNGGKLLFLWIRQETPILPNRDRHLNKDFVMYVNEGHIFGKGRFAVSSAAFLPPLRTNFP